MTATLAHTTTERLIPDFSHAGFEELSGGLLRTFAVLMETESTRSAVRVVSWVSAGASGIDDLTGTLVATPSPRGWWVRLNDRSLLVFDSDRENGLLGVLDSWIAEIPDEDRPRVLEVASADADALTVIVGSASSPPPPRPEKLVLADPDRVFVPLWDLQANAAYCYLCRSRWTDRRGVEITEQMLDDFPISVDHLFAVDLQGAEFVSTTLQDILDAYGTADLAIPVHASMLPQGGERWCQDVWGFVLPILDQITFEVLLNQDDLPPEHLAQAVEMLAEFGRPLFLRMPPDIDLLRRHDPSGFSAIGFDGAYHAAAIQDPDRLRTFANAVSESGATPYVIGLSSIEDTLNATNNGYGLIGSDLISAPLHPEPGDQVVEDPAALLRSLITARASGRD